MSSFRRKWGIGLVAVIIVALLAFTLWPSEKEPEYQGKKLSWWLEEPKVGSAAAVSAIGTNALPFLVQWIGYEPPAWRGPFIRAIRRTNTRASDWIYEKTKTKLQLQHNAAWAFGVLGPRATPAIPDLMQLVTNSSPRVARTALFVLNDIGDATVPIILDVFTNAAAYPLIDPRSIGGLMSGPISNKAPLVPILVDCLKSPDRQMALNAVQMLGSLHAEPSVSVSALTNMLGDRDVNLRCQAMRALECFRSDARPAVPVLIQLHHSKDPRTQSVAEVALGDIAPEVLTNGMFEARE